MKVHVNEEVAMFCSCGHLNYLHHLGRCHVCGKTCNHN